jgi:chemotaxis signal transduction protein
MHHLLFRVGSECFAISLRDIEVILPVPILEPLSGVGPGVVGLLRFRERRIPVIDVSVLRGAAPIRPLISTRLVLLQSPATTPSRLALMVEHALEVVELAPADALPNAVSDERDYWLFPEVISSGPFLVRIANWTKLLTEELLELAASGSQGE